MWYKLTYVCSDRDSCDTLVEVTAPKEELGYAWCITCGKPLDLISLENAPVWP